VEWAASSAIFRRPGWMARLGELAASGIAAVELSAAFGPNAGEHLTFDYTDPNAIEAVASALARAGLALHSMHGPMILGPYVAESPFGAAGLPGLIEAEFAATDALMALGGRFLVTQDAAEREPRDAAHLASRESLGALAEYAAAHGCVFCIENGAEGPDGFERLVETVHGLAHPGLGICLDVGHAQVWAYQDAPRAIRAAGAWLRTCHLHDNIGVADAHLPIGDGILPWHAVIEALSQVGYRGPFVCEAWSGGGRGEVVDVLRKSCSLVDSLAGREWEPAAHAGGFRVFVPTPADRARAGAVLAPAPPALDTGPASRLVVDRFGDPVGWVQFVGSGIPEMQAAATGRLDAPSREAILRAALRSALEDLGPGGVFGAADEARQMLSSWGVGAGAGGTFGARAVLEALG
jgi:sugar phosphate isomerase/epimerase